MITEPTQVPNQTVDDKAPLPVEEDAESKKEANVPLENGMASVAEEVPVAVETVVSNKNDAAPVTEVVAPKTQEEAPKKSFASVVSLCVAISLPKLW